MAQRYEFNVLVAKTISHPFAALTREISFLPLEHKIHIFEPPCNIVYIFFKAGVPQNKIHHLAFQKLQNRLLQNTVVSNAGISGHPGGSTPRQPAGMVGDLLKNLAREPGAFAFRGKHPRDPIHGICRWSRSIMVSANSLQSQARPIDDGLAFRRVIFH